MRGQIGSAAFLVLAFGLLKPTACAQDRNAAISGCNEFAALAASVQDPAAQEKARARMDETWDEISTFHLTSSDCPSLLRVLSSIGGFAEESDRFQDLQVLAWKYMVDQPEAHQSHPAGAESYFEIAARHLAEIYLFSGCMHSSAYWFKAAIAEAQSWKGPRNEQEDVSLAADYHDLGTSYMQLGRIEDARTSFGLASAIIDRHPLRAGMQPVLPALVEIDVGDHKRGEQMLRAFHEAFPRDDVRALFTHVKVYRAEALLAIALDRTDDALKVAFDAIDLIHTFSESHQDDESKFATELDNAIVEAIWGKVLVVQHRYSDALPHLKKASAIALDNAPTGRMYPELVDAVLDLARLELFYQDYPSAFAAYSKALQYYSLFVGWQPTASRRMVWITKEESVVNEMVSTWLSLPVREVKSNSLPDVANGLLQLKANLMLAVNVNRTWIYRRTQGADRALFRANRRYAQAAYVAYSKDAQDPAWLEVDEAFRAREALESQLQAGVEGFNPDIAIIYSFDFRNLQDTKEDTLISYSPVAYGVPSNGLPANHFEQILVGVKLHSGVFQLENLGERNKLASVLESFRAEASRQSSTDFDSFITASHMAFQALIKPFSPVAGNMFIAPDDSSLAGVPFVALLDGTHYLIEEHEVAINHSLLLKENLFHSQRMQVFTRFPPTDDKAMLIGNPDYQGSPWPSLNGSRVEIEKIEQILPQLDIKHQDIEVRLGTSANSEVLENLSRPRILHIAAHGDFSGPNNGSNIEGAPPHDFWPFDEIGLRPMDRLDDAELRSSLILSALKGNAAQGETPTRRVSALEFSSLNFIGTDLVMLSGCDSGRGAASSGAGVFGFQYALQSTMAKYALLSLWNISDSATVDIATKIYSYWAKEPHRDLAAAYTRLLREMSRSDGSLVPPSLWASFALIDQDY